MTLQQQLPSFPRFPYLEIQHKSFALYREAAIFTEDIIVSNMGKSLSVYEAGDKRNPTVVLVNPLGISCLFMTALARTLADQYHLITWESRGLPDYAAATTDSAKEWELETHCNDLALILDKKQCQAQAIITYCSGANIAVYGLAQEMVQTQRLCLVSPSLQMGEIGKRTDYQRSVLPLWNKIAQDGLRTAALIRVLLRQTEKTYACAIDTELAIINSLPFQSDESTYRYARLHAPCVQLEAAALLRQVKVPTLILHDAEDEVIHADTASAVAAALPSAQLSWMNDGGHFAIYKSQQLRSQIAAFLANSS